MKKTDLKVIMLTIGIITLVSCGSKEEKKALPPPEVPVYEVTSQDVPIYEEFVGETFGIFDISIRARVEGFLEGMHFEEGSIVHRGQLLYSIDPQPFEAKLAEAKSQLAEANTILVKAESDLNRYKPLAAINAVSQRDLDAAVAQYGASQASVEAAEASVRLAEIQLGYCRISSPITGIIGRTEAKEGEFVGREPNPVVLNVVSRTDTIQVRFNISESKYLELAQFALTEEGKDVVDNRPEKNERRGLDLYLSDGSKHNHTGYVDFVNRQVDPTTGSLLIQASFPNPNNLIRPGQFARLRGVIDFKPNAVIVPQRCVQEIQGQRSVFVIDQQDTVRARQVILGAEINDYYVVEDGLNAGEHIVIDALQSVRSGLKVSPVPTEFKSQFSPISK